MRVLVTGSRGTLGRPLVDELRDRGHDVWGCDLGHDPDPYTFRADVAEYRQLADVFAGVMPQLVYHLAAEFGRHNGDLFYEQLWRTAMVGGRNVLDLCRRYGSRLAFASSSEVYGEHPGEDGQLTEGITERDVILHPNDYALSKWAGERQILGFVRRHPDTEVMRLRFFNAYGPGEIPHPFRSVVSLFCGLALRDDDLPVFEGYHRTFMYIDDFIPTLANVALNFVSGSAVNIGGRDYRSVQELAEIVIETVGRGRIKIIGEDRHNTRSKRPDISTAEQLLGHDPVTTLEDGVPSTLQWMADVVG